MIMMTIVEYEGQQSSIKRELLMVKVICGSLCSI